MIAEMEGWILGVAGPAPAARTSAFSVASGAASNSVGASAIPEPSFVPNSGFRSFIAGPGFGSGSQSRGGSIRA
jgi:hypothetical protein